MSPMPSLRIGTRGSTLATTQSGTVRDALTDAGFAAELAIVTTHGDVNMAPVQRIGVGVFTQRLREALAAGECELAVHSFKDLPTAADERFHLVIPHRADPREALIARDGFTLSTLPRGARVGTGAPRRIAQLKAIRPDLDIRPLRGNIDTRMGKVDEGELDAVVLAYAGLLRVGQAERATEVLPLDAVLPAPAQGALAVECAADNTEAVRAIETLRDEEATVTALAERALLAKLEAGCTAPVGAHAQIVDDRVELKAGVFGIDGSRGLVEELSGPADRDSALSLGAEAAERLLSLGASKLLGA